MSLAASKEAIGAVSDLLVATLSARSGVAKVTVGRPEEASKNAHGGTSSFNLFLYRTSVDGSLRNRPLDAGQAPPVWLVLHYLLTAFDGQDSDSSAAHRLLGRGLVALNTSPVIRPDTTDAVLASNPEPLRLSFEDADTELLSKIMQGSDEKYRVSAAFQVRPVMLASVDDPPGYALPVRTIGPPTPLPIPPGGRPYVGPVVLGGLGARVDSVEPERFASGQTLVLRGQDFAGYDQILVGARSYPATLTGDGGLSATIPLADPPTVPPTPGLAAGAYPVCAARALDATHTWSSNAVTGHLLPTVTGAALVGALTQVLPASVPPKFSGSFRVDGLRFGGPAAAAYAALYAGGQSLLLLEPQSASDTGLTFTIGDAQALPAGTYAVILRVNGEQALDAPQLNWS